jgi:catechol 2,3-dioxygenase-like lactoylglutathione lyase family enzyme
MPHPVPGGTGTAWDDAAIRRAGRRAPPVIEGIGAVTLATHDMPRAVRFYRALGFEVVYGGEASPFTSLRAGGGHLNLACRPAQQRWRRWGRVIFRVADVDALHERALAA